jgi:hypothetical protein
MKADHEHPVGLHYRADVRRADAKQQHASIASSAPSFRQSRSSMSCDRAAGTDRVYRVEISLSGRDSPLEGRLASRPGRFSVLLNDG